LNSNKTYIEVSEEEKALFISWLSEKERDLMHQLNTIKSLLGKIGVSGSYQMDTKINGKGKTSDIPMEAIEINPKWAAKSLKVLKLHKSKMDSSQVVDYLMEHDPYAKVLPRVEVMRGVSSRLNQLVNRGKAKKEEINGRPHYSYIKD
jgi:hypothetical protein